jgi:hypothetical protein
MTAPARVGAPDDVVGVVDAYLAMRGDGAAGGAFYDLHAPEAMLLVDGKAVPRAAVAREAFAASHAAADGAWLPAAGAAETDWHGDPEQGVAHVSLAEGAARLALGLRRLDGAWCVAFATVVDEPVGFEKGLALALAEFPYLEGLPEARYRAWPDLAYRRRFAAPRPALGFLPEARFGCQSLSTCCKTEWEIIVPPEAQAFVDALPFGEKLDAKEDGRLVVKRRMEACRFLDADRRCKIHAYLGTPVFTPCVEFPVRFTETEAGMDVSLSFTCGTARGGIGPSLESRSDDLWRRYAQAGPNFVAKPRLTRDQDVAWPDFRAAEAELLAVLRIHALPLHRRLWIGTRLLEARLAGGPGDVDAFGLELLAPLAGPERQFIEIYLPYLVGVTAMLDDEMAPATALRFGSTRIHDEAKVAYWFENVLFAKDLSTQFGLVTANALLTVLYAFVAALETARGGPMDDRLWNALCTAVDHRILALGGWKQLFELVPAVAGNLDRPEGAQMLLRHVHWASRR